MFLRQSTASQEIKLGPFLDDADGKTAETGLTIANTDIKLTKGGATTEANKNSGGATHVAGGRYSAVLDDTDTDTVGILEIDVHVSGALPVRRQYYVVEEAVYDAFFAASAVGIPSIPANWITASGLAADAGTEIADAVLSRSVSTVEGTAAEHTLCTIILALLENSISGTTLTIKRTNGSTTHVTKTLTTDAGADPITGIG